MGVAGEADGSRSPEPVSALPAGREPEITIHAVGRAVPTSQSSDVKTRKDFGDYLDLFFFFFHLGHSFHFIVREAGPGRISDQPKTTEPLVQKQGLASALLTSVSWPGSPHIPSVVSPVGLLPECWLGPVPGIC